MLKLIANKISIVVILLTISIFILVYFTNNNKIDFTAQVKPIINKNCITCHGGVKQKGGFSLLFREEALAKTKSGKYAIVPGYPEKSELIRRINLSDPEDRMPYKHEPLNKEDIEIFSKWIKQGAVWGNHWAYVPVKKISIPEPKAFFGWITKKSEWARNPIDNFIEQKFKEQDLKPSARAEKNILLRRVSLDIIGMPAPENLAKQFLEDNSEQAYGNLVDSLLASPLYGEKWTSMWLDLARYADTKGYERDDSRNIWKYRDWLINAFNADKPYNQFLTEQIAGDLLPNPTDENYIATAFNRNTMTNDEGGTDNEEFRTAAVMDRVNTVWQATMGTTFACVQCHSHPYDPFKHDEYYKFMAFFNNTRDEDTEADYPLLRTYNDSMQLHLNRLITWLNKNISEEKAKEVYTFLKTGQPAYNSLICDSFTNSELSDTKWLALRNNGLCRLKNVNLQDRNQLIFRYQSSTAGGICKIHLDHPDGELIAAIPITPGKVGWSISQTKISKNNGAHNLYFTYSNPQLRKPEETGVIFDWFYFTEELNGNNKPGYQEAKNEFWSLINADVTTTPVMMDNPSFMHRSSYVFDRGNCLMKTNAVNPEVPASLNPFPKNAPKNRFGLAMWLTSKENPLTARTMVNRIWEQIFGTGLAETLEDLGSQGSPPTHPELLDWLSYQFMNDYKWSTKKLIQTIVMSATYQQVSKITAEQLKKDPSNKFYARGVRIRLSAEQIRDQALQASGILSKKMFGPSVFPYQPKGIWLSPWNGAEWVQSSEEDMHRRALYTYWKRSAAYPSMLTFDGVSREVCTVRRIRTNTPLQALTTLNDSAYVDIARNLAYRMQTIAGSSINQQISIGFQLLVNHKIDDLSLKALSNLYKVAYAKVMNSPTKICEITGGMNEHTSAESAALIVVANALLNLDEVITKN